MYKVYARLLRYLRPYAAGMVLAILCMALLGATTSAYTFLSGPLLSALLQGDASALEPVARWVPAFREVMERGDRAELLAWLPLLLLAVALVKGAAYAGQFILSRGIGQRVMGDIRQELFEKMLALPPSFHEAQKRGDLMARSVSDVQQVEQSVTDASMEAIRHLLQIITLVVQAFWMDWRLAAVCFVSVPATYYPVQRFGRFLKRVASEGQSRVGLMTGMLQEVLHGIRIVQAFGGEGETRRRYGEETRRFIRLMDRSVVARGLYSPTMELLGVVGVAVLLRYVGRRMVDGQLSPETFISFLACVFMLYAPIKAIGKLSNYVITGVASAERIFEILDAPVLIADAPDAVALPKARGQVEFRDVCFSYGSREVLHGVSLKVEPGEVVALVGPSGGGKTTLLTLLPRFLDVSSGAVLVDGHDVRKLRLKDLRSQMALVTQEVILFNATLGDNIRYGRPDASEDEVRAAARAAHALEFVERLPDGLNTMLGENGVNLSGGQRQRIAMARALIRNAPILILDEATSALDTESEAHVQAALQNLMRGRTTLVIAHRLSTVQSAHRMVVLDEGRVVEVGTHEELLKKGGTYARLAALSEGQGRTGTPPLLATVV